MRSNQRQSDIANSKYLLCRHVRKTLVAQHPPSGAGGAEHRPRRSATAEVPGMPNLSVETYNAQADHCCPRCRFPSYRCVGGECWLLRPDLERLLLCADLCADLRVRHVRLLGVWLTRFERLAIAKSQPLIFLPPDFNLEKCNAQMDRCCTCCDISFFCFCRLYFGERGRPQGRGTSIRFYKGKHARLSSALQSSIGGFGFRESGSPFSPSDLHLREYSVGAASHGAFRPS
jgi:hypothetical protein